jgi:hypothetical protein
MTRIGGFFTAAVGAATIGILGGCAMPAPEAYKPDLNVNQAMTVDEARNIARATTKYPALFFDFSQKTGVMTIASLDFQPTVLQITSGGKKYAIPLAAIEPKVFGQGTGPCGDSMDGFTEIDLNAKRQGFYFVHPTDACWAVSYSHDNALTQALQAVRYNGAHEITEIESKQLADAFVVLRNEAVKVSQADDAKFAAAVQQYQSMAVKPALPEDARRFAVQAQGAIKDNDFAGAAAYFQQALNVAPWWPEGHYQRAILLSGLDDFDGAIVEMKRYLTLAPNAANARASQDKIYDWERKAPPTAAAQTSMSSGPAK